MKYILLKGSDREFKLVEHPTECPHCHHAIVPLPLFTHETENSCFDVFMLCPHTSCNSTFIAAYRSRSWDIMDYQYTKSLNSAEEKTFPDTINNICSVFSEIYNQAFAAEQGDLNQICGSGYRKALEFLIKDYCIKNKLGEKDQVEKLLLGQVIDKYVSNENIKNVAKRAAWIGNDEAHYKRIWVDKDLNTLKGLIDLAVGWIHMEETTKSIISEMPEKKKGDKS